MSTFISHLNHDLALKVLPPTSLPPTPSPALSTERKYSLRSYFLELEPPSSLPAARQCLATLQGFESQGHEALAETHDEEELTLRRAILGKVVIGLYIQALSTFLNEASEADTELEWWSDIERSRWTIAHYLLQTLPSRLLKLSRTILQTLRAQNIPLHPYALAPSSLRRLFPTTNVLRPNTLTIALFPYLRHRPYAVTLFALHLPTASSLATTSSKGIASNLQAFVTSLSDIARSLLTIITLPIELTWGECNYKRRELTKIRDERAEVLGTLAEMRAQLISALEAESNEEGMSGLARFANQLQAAVQGGGEVSPTTQVPASGILGSLYAFAYTTLPSHISSHAMYIEAHGLRRPSRLTLLWPRLVLLPPLGLYTARAAYESRASLDQMVRDAWETVTGFWEGWLVEPLKGIVRTVRAGSEDSVIVSRESVKADLDSLERMALALAKEKLQYGPEQMAALSQQVRQGDLTPVMEIYENDIRSPLRSALGGTLLRTLFVQLQKAKVDIDQALSGIDKLLKSQELTFAFVGVAPALAIVYGAVGYFRSLYTSGRGRGRYGGKKRRVSVWLTMRRIERLLVAQPSVNQATRPAFASSPSYITPLTSGLLLLSVTHLRRYAEAYLPAHSRLREGFLEDVTDLEDPALGRAEKMRVVDRMWKSWGDVLEWRQAAH